MSKLLTISLCLLIMIICVSAGGDKFETSSKPDQVSSSQGALESWTFSEPPPSNWTDTPDSTIAGDLQFSSAPSEKRTICIDNFDCNVSCTRDCPGGFELDGEKQESEDGSFLVFCCKEI